MAEAQRLAAGIQYLPDTPDSWRRKLEVPELVHFIDAYETPFYTFTSKVQGKAPTPDYKFWTQEHRPLPDVGYVKSVTGVWDGGSSADSGSQGDTIVITTAATSGGATDSSFFYPNLVVKNTTNSDPRGDWVAVVTDVVGDNVTLKLLSGKADDDNIPDPADGNRLMFMSTAYPDGSDRGVVISKDNTRDYNFTQIMRMPIEITKRMAASQLHGDDKLATMKRDAIRHWKRLTERAFLFGIRSELDATAGNYERTTTEGIVTWIERVGADNSDVHVIDHYTGGESAPGAGSLAAYTWDHFMSDTEKLFRFKSGNAKMMLCDRSVISHFNSSAFLNRGQAQWTFDTSSNAYGISKYVFSSPFGTLELIECPALMDAFPSTQKHKAVIVDPGSVRQRVLEDVHWEDTSVNGNALTGQQELYGDIGLEFNSPENCGLIVWD